MSILCFLEQRISRRVYQLPCLTWLSLSNIHRVSFSYNLARHCEHEFSLSGPRLTIVCRDSLCLNYTILKLGVSSRLFMVSSRLFIVELRSHITEVSNVHEFNKPIHATVFKSTTNPGRFRTKIHCLNLGGELKMYYKRHTRRLFCLKKDVVTISITGKAREYSRSQWRANSYEKDTA